MLILLHGTLSGTALSFSSGVLLSEILKKNYKSGRDTADVALDASDREHWSTSYGCNVQQDLLCDFVEYTAGVARVVLLVSEYSDWLTLMPAWKQMSQDSRFVVNVVLAFGASDTNRIQNWLRARDQLVANSVPFFNADCIFWEKLKPHVVCCALSDAKEKLDRHYFKCFNQLGARLTYFVNFGGLKNVVDIQSRYSALDLALAWKIVVHSESCRKHFARYCASGNGHVVVIDPDLSADRSGSNAADSIYSQLLGDQNAFLRPPIASQDHANASAYWATSFNTYLASPDYYNKQETILREWLNGQQAFGSIIDIGCGDGRFTGVFADYAGDVLGVDISPSLIEQAERFAAHSGKSNITWNVASLDDFKNIVDYDLVSCLGVLSGFIDDHAFMRAVSSLVASVRDQGILLVKDTLSLGADRLVSGEYTALYRNVEDYLAAFTGCGLVMDEELPLSESQDACFKNSIFVFKKGG